MSKPGPKRKTKRPPSRPPSRAPPRRPAPKPPSKAAPKPPSKPSSRAPPRRPAPKPPSKATRRRPAPQPQVMDKILFGKSSQADFNSKEAIIKRVEEILPQVEKFTVLKSETSMVNLDLQFIEKDELENGVLGGRLGKITWQNYYVPLSKAFQNKTDRLFSVVSHNSAHHMSCFLAIHAFQNKKLMKNDIKVVVSFDQHLDWGFYTGASINCQNWGACLRTSKLHKKDEVRQFFADYYVVIGSTESARVTLLNNKKIGIKLDDQTADGDIETNMNKIINEIRKLEKKEKKEALDWKDLDVYVTVDRDFVKGSCTTYGDGAYHIILGRNAVNELLETLSEKKSNLVGFDVTGLPCGTEEKAPSFVIKNKTAWANNKLNSEIIDWAMFDIEVFFGAVRKNFGMSWKPVYFDMSKQMLIHQRKKGTITVEVHSKM